MTDAVLSFDQMDTDVRFYHEVDERTFFEWLERIPCVASVMGEGRRGLVVTLKHAPGEDDLLQFLALGRRYGFDMHKLAVFETDANRAWFRDPIAYWHDAVFGGCNDILVS